VTLGIVNSGRRWIKGLAAALLFSLVLIGLVFALDFPPLTGRVVDQADIITPQARSDIETKLKDLEDKSGIQLVVATVKSLQGGDIETYANELFRAWKLGQSQKNNGVLLLVAPNEHKVRIEVGYGLEPVLTDAMSSVILQEQVLPKFRTGDVEGGVVAGTDAIIAQLDADPAQAQANVQAAAAQPVRHPNPIPVIFLLIFVFFILRALFSIGRRGGGGGLWALPFLFMGGGGGGGSYGGGGFGGGGSGFGGGGGSFGGGGASGGW
jgi:uncharacterized protein